MIGLLSSQVKKRPPLPLTSEGAQKTDPAGQLKHR